MSGQHLPGAAVRAAGAAARRGPRHDQTAAAAAVALAAVAAVGAALRRPGARRSGVRRGAAPLTGARQRCVARALREEQHRDAVAMRSLATERRTYEGAPIGPPPDLPSLLLKNRIVYLGSPITNEVAELIIAQLLYLNYESADKPVIMYINSTGSTLKNSTRHVGEQKVGMETDAFAIADCMAYIKPQVQTYAIGQAYGTAAMLLGLGARGKRCALPNTTIMLSEPREPPAQGPRQAADLKILAQEVLQNRATMSEMLAKATDKTPEQIVTDTQRCYYMSPDEAVEYNLIDQVLTPEKVKEQLKEAGQELPSFIAAL